MRRIALCNRHQDQLNINKITKDTYICTKVRWMNTKITNVIPRERKTCERKRIVYLDRVIFGSLYVKSMNISKIRR